MDNPDELLQRQARVRLRASIDLAIPDIEEVLENVQEAHIKGSGLGEFEQLSFLTKDLDDTVQTSHGHGPESTKNLLYNWSGIKCIARRDQIHYPTTEAEVINLVKNAKSKVHVIGTGLSYQQIMSLSLDDDEAILLSLRSFTGLIRHTDTTATFGAATPVNDVIATLGKLHRSLTCSLGVIGIQTLAGAMSTGTHGQGLYQSDYASTVVSLRVVLPDGSVSTVDDASDTSSLPLGAFIVALGSLGIILEVEVRTEPRRVFHCTKIALPYTEFLANYCEWNRDYEYVKVWWFPETDQCQVWLVDDGTVEQVNAFNATDRSTALKDSEQSDSMNATVERYLETMSHDTKASSASDKPQFRTVRRFADAVDLIGYQEQILCKGIPLPQINCEIAVPCDKFQAATEALHRFSREQPGKSLHYPFIYRAAGQSAAWLSAAAPGPVVWIGFLVYVAEDGTVRSDGMETMRRLQQILREYDGLPHWGKHFTESCYDFEQLLKKFDDFRRLRRKLDPTKKLLSQYLTGLLG